MTHPWIGATREDGTLDLYAAQTGAWIRQLTPEETQTYWHAVAQITNSEEYAQGLVDGALFDEDGTVYAM